jgi:hypothetical protein
MKTFGTLVAAAVLTAAACGAAQAHTDINVGLGIGGWQPMYVAPPPPQPIYYGYYGGYRERGWEDRDDRHHERRDDRRDYRHDHRD